MHSRVETRHKIVQSEFHFFRVWGSRRWVPVVASDHKPVVSIDVVHAGVVSVWGAGVIPKWV